MRYQIKIGDTFGLWVVVSTPPSTCDKKHRHSECSCICGHTKMVRNDHLGSGRSNGCRACTTITHNMTNSKAYHTWEGMIDRCENTKNKCYQRYGGRGIRVCSRWMSFENFYEDMGDPATGLSIDRIDNDSGYCPENCRWATPKQQARNTSANRLITHEGKTLCLTAWAEWTGLAVSTLASRLDRGWSSERALTTPPQKS